MGVPIPLHSIADEVKMYCGVIRKSFNVQYVFEVFRTSRRAPYGLVLYIYRYTRDINF
jgi:hypothetical protein